VGSSRCLPRGPGPANRAALPQSGIEDGPSTSPPAEPRGRSLRSGRWVDGTADW